MKTYTQQPKPQSVYSPIAASILIASLVLLIVLYSARHTEPKRYSLTIVELGDESMLAHSDSEELGLGEIILVYDKDMVIEDVNGQIIDFTELGIGDSIRVEIAPREKVDDGDSCSDLIVERIILLPDNSDEYV